MVYIVMPSGCFPAGALVLTSLNGYIPIEKVTRHDTIMSHKGVFRDIVNCIDSIYTGYIYYIYSTLGFSPIQCTENTLFYVKKIGGEPAWVKAKDLTEYHFVCMPLETTYTDCSPQATAIEHQRYLAHIGHLHGIYENMNMEECACQAEAFIEDGCAWFKITEIEWSKEPAQCVYSFECDTDDSYIVQNVAVRHNLPT